MDSEIRAALKSMLAEFGTRATCCGARHPQRKAAIASLARVLEKYK